MNDPRLAAALLTSSPDALADLFDAYGDRLFRYCWSMLRSREMAQVALRDTLLVAQAHIARLADPEDPESLGPWLYALARAECRRHQALPAAGDEPGGRRVRGARARLPALRGPRPGPRPAGRGGRGPARPSPAEPGAGARRRGPGRPRSR